MKKFTLIAFLFWSAFLGYGQLIISSGSHLVISNSSEVVANDITNLGGNITNDGTLTVKGDLTNTSTGLLTSNSTGKVTFMGSSAQKITGDTDAGFYGTLEINNASGVSIASTGTYSGSDQTVNGQLIFTDGMLSLNDFDLTLGTTDPTGITSAKYIKTNASGGLQRNVPNDATNITYHVGNSTYNPLILQNSATATADTYKVVVVDNEPKNSVTSHMVNRSWEVTESVANGSKLTVTPQWNLGEELSNFDRSNTAVGLTADAGSTYNWKTYGAASGTYTRSGSTFTGVGTFVVADKDYVSDNTTVADVDIVSPDTDCFNAINILTVAEEETVTVENGGQATFVAGQKIVFKPGFHSQSGSSSHAYITETGDYCNSIPPLMANIDNGDGTTENYDDLAGIFEDMDSEITLYPNPTRDRFVIAFSDKQISTNILLLNLQGSIVGKTICEGMFSKELSIGHLPQGMYIVIIKTKERMITKKIIKNY